MEKRTIIVIEVIELIFIAFLIYYIVHQMKIPEEGE